MSRVAIRGDHGGRRAQPQGLVQHLNGVSQAGHVVGGEFAIADGGDLGGDPVLQVGVASQRPQRVGQGGCGGVVAGRA